MRNPLGPMPGQNWTGNDDEDYEQSCMPTDHPLAPTPYTDDNPGRAAFEACNYTCQYLLAGLEPDRFQVPCPVCPRPPSHPGARLISVPA